MKHENLLKIFSAASLKRGEEGLNSYSLSLACLQWLRDTYTHTTSLEAYVKSSRLYKIMNVIY